MKIGIITAYEKFPGGVESVNAELSSAFESLGHTVEIVATDSNHHIPIYIKLLKKLFGSPIITSYIFNKHYKERFDLVICNGEYNFGISHPNKVTLFHGCYYGYYKKLFNFIGLRTRLNLLRHGFIQTVHTKNSRVVCVSSFIKNYLNDFNVCVDKVINNGVDPDEFKPINSVKSGDLFFVGSYDYYGKGIDILESLSDKYKADITCITGKDELSFGLQSLGSVERSKMCELYNKYKIFVFPSRYEGCQMSPIEAMSCGIPVIISEVGMGSELREDIPEFVLNVDSFVEDFPKTFDTIMNNYEEFSKKAREIALRKYSKEVFKENWLSYLKEDLNGKD